jgi:3-methyl-2-oxobutanoate hydroxymethyltransferase
MSAGRVRTTELRDRKKRGEKIAVLTAYDATTARLLERAGIDVMLVGDSLGMVVLGHDTTLPVTLDMMVHHTAAVVRGTEHALIVADMPFMTYQVSVSEAVRNAGRLLQEGGAAAVKLEGGRAMLDVVARLVDVGIPVMGHLGLLPQSVHQLGGYRRQANQPRDADALLADAVALERAGAFALVLESIPAPLAEMVTARVEIPTIGIGAGAGSAGQVLVTTDFARQYASLRETILEAARAYADDVRAGRFPESTAPIAGTKSR